MVEKREINLLTPELVKRGERDTAGTVVSGTLLPGRRRAASKERERRHVLE
jgi:hypothetical protein